VVLVVVFLPHTVNCGRFCFWCCQSVFFCLCMKYLGETLNGFVQNSDGRRVWYLARTILKVKVKGQGHQGQKTVFFGPFGGLHAVYVLVKRL